MSEINKRGSRERERVGRAEMSGWSPAQLYEYARQMRAVPTEAEEVLWTELRSDGLGIRFRRQYVLGSYIVDFVCLPRRLIVEVDGPIHDTPEAVAADQIRTDVLARAGYFVIRFTNHEVLHRLTAVCSNIREALASRAS